MIHLNPQILEKHGKKEFVILQYEDFLKIQEELENYLQLGWLKGGKKSNSNRIWMNKNDVNIKILTWVFQKVTIDSAVFQEIFSYFRTNLHRYSFIT